jgi:hypothetical protein
MRIGLRIDEDHKYSAIGMVGRHERTWTFVTLRYDLGL